MHDVFISYSSKDTTTANAVCHILEESGMRCFIAPRDIDPGALWAEALVGAIRESRVFVLVFSRNSNQSKQVHKEIGIAVDAGLTVIPFITSSDKPHGALEYYMADTHWIDALTPPLEGHIHHLAQSISALLDLPEEDGPTRQAVPNPAVIDPGDDTDNDRPPKTGETVCARCGYHHGLSHCPICGSASISDALFAKRKKTWKILAICVWAVLAVYSALPLYAAISSSDGVYIWTEYIVMGLMGADLVVLLSFAGIMVFRRSRIRRRLRLSGEGPAGTLRRKNLAFYRGAFITGGVFVALHLAGLVLMLLSY